MKPEGFVHMETSLEFNILRQPDDTTCGPTCLQAVYRYHGDEVPLPQVIHEVETLEEGGTIAVLLGLHALGRGYRATIYTYNLEVFDPTWFRTRDVSLGDKLRAQLKHKRSNRKLALATRGYLEFLDRGGRIRMENIERSLITRHLRKGVPILTGLSSTFLYQEPRELPNAKPDDLAGKPQGHFVVLHGYRKEGREVQIADPYEPNRLGQGRYYAVPVERVISAILLGILTYDANLLIIEEPEKRARH